MTTSPPIGVLSDRDIRVMMEAGQIRGGHIQPASLDIPLGRRGYQIRASFLPRHRTVLDAMTDVALEPIEIPETGFIVMPGTALLIEGAVDFDLPAGLEVRASPKSSIGRLDMLVRLICDHSDRYDQVPSGLRGRPWIEITSRSFPVRIRPGICLNQVRFRQGGRAVEIDDADLPAIIAQGEFQCAPDPVIADGICLGVHLDEPPGTPVGYRAKRNSGVIDLAKIAGYPMGDFWEPVFSRKGTLILEHDTFYILASHERIGISPSYSADMIAFDPSAGEFRAHYAGYLDAGFGHNSEFPPRAVLEVRSVYGAFIVEHRQFMARIKLEKLLSQPEKPYGAAIGSSYHNQGLKLAKYFC
jgi:dCTP deaminase